MEIGVLSSAGLISLAKWTFKMFSSAELERHAYICVRMCVRVCVFVLACVCMCCARQNLNICTLAFAMCVQKKCVSMYL